MNLIRQREEFHFTRDQLASLLHGTIAEFEERRAAPGANDRHSQSHTTGWMLHRLDAEAEKVEKGLGTAAMQTMPSRVEEAARDLKKVCEESKPDLVDALPRLLEAVTVGLAHLPEMRKQSVENRNENRANQQTQEPGPDRQQRRGVELSR